MDVALYESEELHSVTGPFIRPGGLSLTDRAMDFCGFTADAAIVDVGCGSGGTVEHLLNVYGANVCGIDPSDALLAVGRNRSPLLPIKKGVAESLPFADRSADGIFCECVFSILEDQAQALREFARVLKPEGFLVITDVYLRSTSGTANRSSNTGCCVAGARPMYELEEALYKQGFSALLWEDHTLALKELAVQLILSNGSLDGFFSPSCAAGSGSSMKAGRPGYFLLVAQNCKDKWREKSWTT